MASGLEIAVVVACYAGYLIYRAHRRSKYPHRLVELEAALGTQADLLRHRNHDEYAAQRFGKLQEQLANAQALVNGLPAEVAREWPKLCGPLGHMTSEDLLTQVGLYYTDRREDTRAAVYDLRARLEKMAARHQ